MGEVRAWVVAIGVAFAAGLAGPWAFADPAAAGERVVCRSFSYDPFKAEIDTRDPGSEVGKWVADHEDRGWRVSSVQPQVVVKATGVQDGWAHVCVVPVR